MGSGAIKWHVHCSVCGAFIEKSAQSDSEVECKKCRSTLEIFVKDDMVSVVTVDGGEYYSSLLAGENQQSERREIDIDGHNKVVITDGEVWMEEADCPDKLCVLQGKISRSGQTIICLPNKTMVTIKGGKSEYDGVAQ